MTPLPLRLLFKPNIDDDAHIVVRFIAGYPQPEYRWMKDGVFQTEFSSEPVYKIQSIRREDAGVYQCVARNAVGAIFSDQVQVLVACTLPSFSFFNV